MVCALPPVNLGLKVARPTHPSPPHGSRGGSLTPEGEHRAAQFAGALFTGGEHRPSPVQPKVGRPWAAPPRLRLPP